MVSLIEKFLNLGGRKSSRRKEEFYRSFVRDILESESMISPDSSEQNYRPATSEELLFKCNSNKLLPIHAIKNHSLITDDPILKTMEKSSNGFVNISVFKTVISSKKCRVVCLEKNKAYAVFFVFRLLNTEEKSRIVDFFNKHLLGPDFIKPFHNRVKDSKGNRMQIVDDYYFALNFYDSNW